VAAARAGRGGEEARERRRPRGAGAGGYSRRLRRGRAAVMASADGIEDGCREDGGRRWRRSYGVGRPIYGFSSSVAAFGDAKGVFGSSGQLNDSYLSRDFTKIGCLVARFSHMGTARLT
jgi:hypothetical protein